MTDERYPDVKNDPVPTDEPWTPPTEEPEDAPANPDPAPKPDEPTQEDI